MQQCLEWDFSCYFIIFSKATLFMKLGTNPDVKIQRKELHHGGTG